MLLTAGNRLRAENVPRRAETGNVLNSNIQVNSKAPGNPSDPSVGRNENLILLDTHRVFYDSEMRRFRTSAGYEIEPQVVPETRHCAAHDPICSDGSLVVRTDVVNCLNAAANVEEPDFAAHHHHQLAGTGRNFMHRSHTKKSLASP